MLKTCPVPGSTIICLSQASESIDTQFIPLPNALLPLHYVGNDFFHLYLGIEEDIPAAFCPPIFSRRHRWLQSACTPGLKCFAWRLDFFYVCRYCNVNVAGTTVDRVQLPVPMLTILTNCRFHDGPLRQIQNHGLLHHQSFGK
ncbi:hypothetical protein BH10PLA2_BH10PLA2_16850 [soil metagenome]